MSAHAVTLRQFCSGILASGNLESKLAPPMQRGGDPLDDTDPGQPLYVDYPNRDPGLVMSRGNAPLPRPSALRSKEARAKCLARFAHHELMAVELFAWALLRWPDLPPGLREGFVRALADEQRHCRLYLDRLVALGAEFSNYRHSNYFWQHAPAIAASPHGPRAFLAAVGLTLEQANLDFTLLYRDAFRAAGDEETATVLQQVHDDEVNHVAMAAEWIRALGPPGTDTIEAYCEAVPYPLSAARAKSRRFDVTGRRRAGLDEAFIQWVRSARSNQETARRRQHRPDAPREAEPTPLTLFPNLGAEEIPGKGGVVMSQATFPTLRLWRLLFPEDTCFMIPVCPVETRRVLQRLNDPWWPEALSDPAKDSAFSWLEDAEGIVPWVPTARIQAHPTYRHQPIWAAPPGIVARVHDKAFALRVAEEEGLLPEPLRGLSLVLDPADLLDSDAAIAKMETAMAGWPEWAGRNFTLKPRLGTSGRGRVPGVNGAPDSTAVRGALKRLSRKGGAILEPWFKRIVDLSAQAYIAPGGEVTLLGTLEQIVAPSGVYLGHCGEMDSRGRVSSGRPEDETLREALAVVARRAASEGFHGPCGIDAFTLSATDPDGSERVLLRPVVELNARFTMGTIAIGLIRRGLGTIREATNLLPGMRRAFYFGLDAPDGGWIEACARVEGESKFIPLWHPDEEVCPGLLVADDREALEPVIEAVHRARSRR